MGNAAAFQFNSCSAVGFQRNSLAAGGPPLIGSYSSRSLHLIGCYC